MALDPLGRARNAFLHHAFDALEHLDLDDLATAWRSQIPRLRTAWLDARTAAVNHVERHELDEIARRSGMDLGWELIDRDAYLGPTAQDNFARRLHGIADWLEDQQAAGADPEQLRTQVTYWSQQIAGSTVHDTARRAGLDIGGNSPLHGRYMRVAEPQACRFCIAMASRGPVYVSDSTAAAVGHGNCRCDIVLVVNEQAIKALREEGAVAWQRAEWAGQWSGEQARRQRGSKSARAPITQPNVDKPGDLTRQRMVSVDLQISTYEKSLRRLRTRAADGDDVSKAITWQETQVAKLTAERSTLQSSLGTLPATRNRGEVWTGYSRAHLPVAGPRPTYEGLLIEGSIGRGWEHFEPSELPFAEWLRSIGVEVRSVIDRDVWFKQFRRLKSPECVDDALQRTIEFKAAESLDGVENLVRKAFHQSDNVIISIGQGQGPVDEAAAARLRQDLRGKYAQRGMRWLEFLIDDGSGVLRQVP